MSKKRNSAAIVGLLDAIKSEGIIPVKENNFSLLEEKLPEEIEKVTLQQTIPFKIVSIDPNECKVWGMANRLSEYITDASCEALIENIKIIGQQIPAIVRISIPHQYEVICGARRLYACKKLGIRLLAAVVDLDDQDALLVMDAENRPREDISPYERALDYTNWIKKGFFENHNSIAEAVGFKKSWFSKLMSLAELDTEIVRAFGHPAFLKQVWGYNLFRLCSSPPYKILIIEKAKELQDKGLTPANVYKQLVNVTKTMPITNEQSYWVVNKNNKKVFKVKRNRLGKTNLAFSVNLPSQKVELLIKKIEQMILEET